MGATRQEPRVREFPGGSLGTSRIWRGESGAKMVFWLWAVLQSAAVELRLGRSFVADRNVCPTGGGGGQWAAGG